MILTPYLSHMYSTYPLLSILIIIIVFTLLWYVNKHPNRYLNKVNHVFDRLLTIQYGLNNLQIIALIGFVIVCIIYTILS